MQCPYGPSHVSIHSFSFLFFHECSHNSLLPLSQPNPCSQTCPKPIAIIPVHSSILSSGYQSARNDVQSNRTRQRILGIIQLHIPFTAHRITDRPRRTRERSNRIIIPRQDLHLAIICANCWSSVIRRRIVRGARKQSKI